MSEAHADLDDIAVALDFHAMAAFLEDAQHAAVVAEHQRVVCRNPRIGPNRGGVEQLRRSARSRVGADECVERAAGVGVEWTSCISRQVSDGGIVIASRIREQSSNSVGVLP